MCIHLFLNPFVTETPGLIPKESPNSQVHFSQVPGGRASLHAWLDPSGSLRFICAPLTLTQGQEDIL